MNHKNICPYKFYYFFKKNQFHRQIVDFFNIFCKLSSKNIIIVDNQKILL